MSSKIDWPGGMTTLSPSRGTALEMPHERSSDHLSMYRNSAAGSITASPRPSEATTTIDGTTKSGRGPVTHVIAVAEADSTAHSMPSMLTAYVAAASKVPDSVSVSPPSVEPTEGATAVTAALRDEEYV